MAAGARAQPWLSLVSVKPDGRGWCWRQVLAKRCRRSIGDCWCRSIRSDRSLHACVWLPSIVLLPGAARAVALWGTVVSPPTCAGCCIPTSPRALGSPCPVPWAPAPAWAGGTPCWGDTMLGAPPDPSWCVMRMGGVTFPARCPGPQFPSVLEAQGRARPRDVPPLPASGCDSSGERRLPRAISSVSLPLVWYRSASTTVYIAHCSK